MRRWMGAALVLTLLASACAVDDVSDVGSGGVQAEAPDTTVAPTRVTTAPVSTTTPTMGLTTGPTTGSTTASTVTEAESVDQPIVDGPGVDHAEFMAALAPLVDAENAMHAFEADWDAGMTYSDTFRGWREVKAIVSEAFDGFALPTDASAEQREAGALYVKAVQGAHDEWQNVTDFIVTYITNYTPEVLILGAYTKAEFRLRDAIAARTAIEALGA